MNNMEPKQVADSVENQEWGTTLAPERNDVSTETPTKAQPDKRRDTAAIVGIIMTIVAWVVLVWTDWLSLGLAVIAIIISFIGIKSRHHFIAVTSVIADAVLLLVFSIFWAVILFLLK
jgi:hypothetical protein